MSKIADKIFLGIVSCVFGLFFLWVVLGSLFNFLNPDVLSYPIRVIVPNDYRGAIRMVFDESGEKLEWSDKTLIYRIPPSGVLVTKGKNPLMEGIADDLFEVIYENGHVIPRPHLWDIPLPDNQKVYYTMFGYGGIDGTELWSAVGTNKIIEEIRKSTYRLK